MFGFARIFGLVWFIPMFVVLIPIFSIFRGYLRSRGAKGWPVTGGRVLHSSVQASHRRDSKGRTSLVYEPAVVYEYLVDGQHFQSQRLSFNAVFGSSLPALAQRVVARFPPGSAVPVFYNPSNPSEAILEYSYSSFNAVLLVILLGVEVMLGFAAWSFLHI